MALWRPCAGAAALPISEAEALQSPTPARLAAIFSASQHHGWDAQTPALRDTAIQAYSQGQFSAAEAWFHVGRWAGLFSESSSHFQARWVEAMRAAQVPIPEISHRWGGQSRTLGEAVTPQLQEWLIDHADFSTEFFALLSPLDYAPNVLRILDEIQLRDPVGFSHYPRLALALAVVYDVPPPARWPHPQVTPSALPRRFPAATEAFAWWTRQDELGRTYQKLGQLDAEELKFVVDAAAPFEELAWSQQISDYPLPLLARTYAMIPYRQDRVANNQTMWPGPTYRLSDILSAGGICVDQAYFASETGKARGVPTLLFLGEGGSGRHAWFGFLDGNRKWHLDAGRTALQRLVSGFAYDPQTWSVLSEHDLSFLAEGFRSEPAFRRSRIHTEFALAFLYANQPATAIAAARRGVEAESRNQAAWATLLAATQAAGRSPQEIEGILRETVRAFARYPDLEALYANRLSASLRSRGDTAGADAEESRITSKNRGSRSDLSVRQARNALLRAADTQSLPRQIQAYDAAVDSLARGGGIAFYDQVVVGFAEHLLALHQPAEAVRAIERAQHAFRIEPGSQLEQELARLLAEAKAAN